jgi:hypothetical protein
MHTWLLQAGNTAWQERNAAWQVLNDDNAWCALQLFRAVFPERDAKLKIH